MKTHPKTRRIIKQIAQECPLDTSGPMMAPKTENGLRKHSKVLDFGIPFWTDFGTKMPPRIGPKSTPGGSQDASEQGCPRKLLSDTCPGDL